MIGLSSYEALCFNGIDLPEYIRRRGGEGYKFVRVFTDLGWGGAAGVVDADKNSYLYEFDKTRKVFLQNKINKQFVAKLYESGKAAKQSGMEGIILCLASNPKYQQKTVKVKGYGNFPWQLGFRETRGFMQVADPSGNAPEYPDNLIRAWGRFTRYIQDLVRICFESPNPFMFRMVETYNELGSWGSIADTHPWIASKVREVVRSGVQFQFNPPIEELEECIEEAKQSKTSDVECYKWPKRLMSGFKGFKATRLSFHGFYKGYEIIQATNLFKKGGIDITRLNFETDGATPNGTFTREEHTKHYLWRLEWRKTPQNITKTIAAHKDLVVNAKKAGVRLNMQDPIKWSLMKPDAANEKFWREVAKAVA